MALQFEIKTLEGLDEITAKLYVKVGDVYRLDVEGIESTEGLKSALEKERTANKEKAAELKLLADAKAIVEAEKAAADTARLEKAGEHQKLSENFKKAANEANQKLADLEAKVAKSKRKAAAVKATAGMSDDVKISELFVEQALKQIESVSDDNVLTGASGVIDAKDLREQLEKDYPSLCKGSAAGGGGSNGGGGNPPGKTMTRSDFDTKTPHEQSKFVNDGGKVTE